MCQSGGKIYEIVEFVHDILKVQKLHGSFHHKVSIHNSCHGLRELKLSAASELDIPYFSKIKKLLSLVEGIEIVEPQKVDECCGFGGMFAIEEQAVSVCMGQDKVTNHIATGAEYITGADSSCLMHMQGAIKRKNLPIKIIHVVEILSSGL
jgi:L-lactate dehydrogenase complex protein LldE